MLNIIIKLAYAPRKAMQTMNDIIYLKRILFRILLATLSQAE